MAVPTNTLTLVTKVDAVTPREGKWRVRVVSANGAVDLSTDESLGGLWEANTVGGVVTFELPDNTHADFEPNGAPYYAWFTPHDRRDKTRLRSGHFDMDVDHNLDDILTAVAGPVDSSILAQSIANVSAAQAAKDDAEAAAASVQRGEPNGVAGLDADGDVIDANGDKVVGGGGGGVSSWNDLTDKPSTFPPSTHNHDSSYYTKTQADTAAAAHAADTTSVHGIPDTLALVSMIFETSTGVWSADPPARAEGDSPIIFVGLTSTSNPKDPTNGVDTIANVNDTDPVLRPSA